MFVSIKPIQSQLVEFTGNDPDAIDASASDCSERVVDVRSNFILESCPQSGIPPGVWYPVRTE